MAADVPRPAADDPQRPASPPPRSAWDAALAGGIEVWEPGGGAGGEHSLTDLVNRVLDKGVVITGEVTISVAGVDLVYLGLSAVLTSISTARRLSARRGEGEADASDDVSGDASRDVVRDTSGDAGRTAAADASRTVDGSAGDAGRGG
jgi:hypothetical protein